MGYTSLLEAMWASLQGSSLWRCPMRRFTAEEVRGILSEDHRFNTAVALSKAPAEVTEDELIEHWLKFHLMTIVIYEVEEEEVLFV